MDFLLILFPAKPLKLFFKMKKLLSLLSLVALIATVSFAQTEVIKDAKVVMEDANTDSPKMDFESLELDYGTIDQGSEPLRVFKFTNTGAAPLVITNAKGSCGCTVPSYPKTPIMPGEESAIEVRYDTNRVGPFTKRVTLTTNENGENTVVLTIKGKVNKKATEPSLPVKEDSSF